MADTKISELTANTSPNAQDVCAVSNQAATNTNKVTLQTIARLYSDNTGITGAARITNLVSVTQSEYDSLSTAGNISATTLYIIEG